MNTKDCGAQVVYPHNTTKVLDFISCIGQAESVSHVKSYLALINNAYRHCNCTQISLVAHFDTPVGLSPCQSQYNSVTSRPIKTLPTTCASPLDELVS